ncbi:FlgO family outer membrane protein [Algicola sagamiensis]|uniref:FlgO family outer membrane protein n=1 Tax=Algicola sagamiensis TaxID=163869 RepID=UPI0003A52547|nr:FlgO family outer membrane protein [Algicola sagamiensis]
MRFALFIMMCICLSGCESMPWFGDETAAEQETNQPVVEQEDSISLSGVPQEGGADYFSQQAGGAFGSATEDGNFLQAVLKFGSDIPVKNINHYVKGMMQDLVHNLKEISADTPLAVASFIYLDGQFDQTDLLGNQIAESFIHEIHQFGIPVLDYKVTDYIRITDKGDFVMTRDYLELKEALPINYILAGTMVNHKGGVLLNARILGMDSKRVVASTQGFIPDQVAKALISSQVESNIRLKSSGTK